MIKNFIYCIGYCIADRLSFALCTVIVIAIMPIKTAILFIEGYAKLLFSHNANTVKYVIPAWMKLTKSLFKACVIYTFMGYARREDVCDEVDESYQEFIDIVDNL